jgi:hypothetical protein
MFGVGHGDLCRSVDIGKRRRRRRVPLEAEYSRRIAKLDQGFSLAGVPADERATGRFRRCRSERHAAERVSAAMQTARSYRVYRLDGRGRFRSGDGFDASDDEHACRRAMDHCDEGAVAIEVWDHARLVRHIACRGAGGL